ncbi:hypothetical protein SVI_2802 [Shewanella violacea DSS12]|uniref:Uncharacterized protein n=1 Tax=Shewanella violacea (strain JCM 10179 / CIP 106290 / LMG 19151 / DSS12) TaxID=637905 RepID=D4ZM74_SHEVD|nr:hypothetical protein SVI_2802 [Shewanella violacea DSS12]
MFSLFKRNQFPDEDTFSSTKHQLVVALPNLAGGVKFCAHVKETRFNKKPAQDAGFFVPQFCIK